MDVTSLAIAAAPAFITRGWRAPLAGTALAVLSLAVIVGALGVALVTVVPEHLLLGFVGTLLLLFGLRWLRKAILRFAGIVALHDEEEIYRREVAELRAQGLSRTAWDWVGMIVAYKATLLEGIEVAFIVIAFGAKGAAAMNAAIAGALAAGVIVIALAAMLRAPLTAVPENWMKFGVGAMLSSFGIFWFGEGIGAHWPGDAASIPIIVAAFLAASWLSVRFLRSLVPEGARVSARNV